MMKKLLARLDVKRLDAVMLVAGLIGGLAGSFLAVRASEHKAHQLEIGAASVAAELHQASAVAAAERDAGAPGHRGIAEHEAEK